MGKVYETTAIKMIVNHFYGNCTLDNAYKIIDKLLDMGFAEVRYCLDGRKVVLLNGWQRVL